MRGIVCIAIALVACRDKPPHQSAPTSREVPQPSLVVSGDGDPALAKDREDFIVDTMAFLDETRDQVENQIRNNTGMKEEWEAWEGSGKMTDDRIKQFYKQTRNYIFDLGGWHLWDLEKRKSDLAMVDELKKAGVKNVLDFGGGVGFNAILLARGGLDVTLADLDSVTLNFAKYRAEKNGVKLKLWKSDVEAMPPDKKYDAILCLDVLEHLPAAELHSTVDKLVALKHDKTQIIIHAPFGRTAQHPMHLDATQETMHQVGRLQKELPKT
jgi:2-polyprenyl-3-methyl-5-hydroxy-6-metoxy-1,4-benzoquinol methylase